MHREETRRAFRDAGVMRDRDQGEADLENDIQGGHRLGHLAD